MVDIHSEPAKIRREKKRKEKKKEPHNENIMSAFFCHNKHLTLHPVT